MTHSKGTDREGHTCLSNWKLKGKGVASAWPINLTQWHPTSTNEGWGTSKGRTPRDIYYVGPKFYNRDKKQVTRLMPPFYNLSRGAMFLFLLQLVCRWIEKEELYFLLVVPCFTGSHGNLWCGLQCHFEVGASIQMHFQCNQLSSQMEGRRRSGRKPKWH